MASVEVIGLLCAGSTRYHGAAGSSGIDRLSKMELAGLLAGLSDAAVNLALAKYALDQDAERLLIAHLRMWASGVAVCEQWHTVRGRPTIVNLAAMAAFEIVRPNRCVRCKGRGAVSMRVCPCCSGSGFRTVSGRQIAQAIGVDECNYRRIWRSRYEKTLAYVQELDQAILWALYANDLRKYADIN